MYCCIDDSSDDSGLFIRREVFPANRVTLPLEPFSTKQLYEKPLLADQITNWPSRCTQALAQGCSMWGSPLP